jgi:succinoglycan biosynthesis transport protein ExoP
VFVDNAYAVLCQQLALILTIAAGVAALGALYAYVTPPTFAARAIMIFDSEKSQVQLGGVLNEVPLDLPGVDSQLRVMKSEAIARAVVKKLDLGSDPDFLNPPKGLRDWINALRPGAASDGAVDRTGAALAILLDRLKVHSAGYVVDVEFSWVRPERAANIANAFAEAYIEDQLRLKDQTAAEAVAWLKNRLEELRDKSLLADQAVVDFKRRNNIISADGRLVNDQEVTQLNGQLILAREKTTEARARLDRAEAVIRASAADPQSVGTITDTLNNQIIVKLRLQGLELTTRHAEWTRQYGADHLAVVKLGEQLKGVRRAIDDELRHIAETYKSELQIAKQREAELESAAATAIRQSQATSGILSELRQLESSAEAYRTLYKATHQRSMELVQQQSYPGADVRLITRASALTARTAPGSAIILAGSAVAGLCLGFGVGVFRALLDRTFHTPAGVESSLQVKCLALAPAVKRATRLGPRPQPGSRRIVRDAIVWEVVERPLSRLAEAMRCIRSAADLSRLDKSNRVLGFTSSVPKEGKSTLAAAFALLAAHSGGRSILVDCDLRNPALSATLAPGAESGLLEVLSGQKPLGEVLWTDATESFSFLPAVMKSRVAESNTILGSPALRALFDELRRQYDHVVVDLSPIAPIVDVQSTAHLVDSYVFVVEWGRTKGDVVELALAKAAPVRASLLGVVLNKVNFKALSRYEGGRRDYYADENYAPYGQI